jgi:hypothetical protein
LLLAALAAADYPPAPGSGGAACKINAQCGIPAANCPSLRGASRGGWRCDCDLAVAGATAFFFLLAG